MPLNPLSNLKLSLPEIEGSENPGKSLSRDLSSVVSNIDYYNPVPLLAPPTPNIIPDDVDINQNLVGNESTGPNPGAKDVQGGTMDFVSATNSAMGQADVWAKDKYKYGRTYSYGAGYKNMNFDRYYEHPKFKDLGFSPYRDNESAYNEKATWTDDFRRMGSSWSKLVMTGAGSTLFLVDDDEAAEAMEKNMAIGSSSKKGAGAWLTNFGLNSAYTLGILGEVALESLALGALEFYSVGTATPVVAIGAADVAYKLGKLGQGFHGLYNAIKALRSVDTAKEFYNIAKMGAHAKDFAKWLNPLQNSAEFTANIIKNTNSFDKLNKLQKTTKGFGAFFNDMRQISLAIEEGGMEAATGASKNHQKRIDTFYEKNGYMPEGADAQKIYDETKSLRSSIQLANNGVIFYSNRLVIGKLLKGFPSASIIAKTIGEESTRTLEKVLAADVLTKGALKFGENTFGKKAAKFLISSQYVPWSRVYITGNISEALQENAQDVIQKGVSAYYDRIDKSPVQAGFWMGVNEIVNASGKQFSAEGLDTFASGFFMGAVAGGVQSGVMSIGKGVSGLRSGNKTKFEQAKIQAEENENQVLNTVNNIAKSAMDIGQSNSEKAAIVKLYSDEMDKAEDAGSQLDFQNAKEELASEQFYSLAKGGKIKLFTDHMDDMLQLEDKDLANAYKKPIEEIKNVREKLSNLKDRANNFKQSYEKAQEIFKNPNDPYLFNEEKQPEIYNEVLSKYRAHEAAVKDILMHTESSKRITKRLLTMANEFNTTSNWLQVRQGISIISNAGAKDIMSLVDSKQMDLEQETLIKEISLLKEGTPQDKKKAVLLQKKLDSQVKWRNQINAYTEELSFDPKNATKEVTERRLFNKRLNKGAVIKEKNSTDDLTVVSSTTNTITVKDKTGKEKTIPKSNIVEITKESTIPIKNTDVILNDYLEDLHSIFNEYATIIAEEQGGTVNNMELNETFIKIKDFNLLERKSKFLTNSINILTDPTYFNTYVKIQQSVQANRIKNELENIREALKIFMGFKKPNDFLNKLYDIGLFIFTDTKNLELFKTDPKSVTYYSVPNKTVIDPVVTKPTDQKMQEIQKIHNEFFPKPTVVTPVVVPAQPTKVPVTTPVVPVAPVTAAVSTKEPITSITPIKDLAKQKILVTELVKAYKEESQTGVLAGKPVLHGVTDTNAKILEVDENDQLINKDFEKFLTLTTASVIFNKFNTSQGRVYTVPPVAEEVIPVEKPVEKPVVVAPIVPVIETTLVVPTTKINTPEPISIKKGSITITTSSTDTWSAYYVFKVENGEIVSGVYKTIFLGEYKDTQNEEIVKNAKEKYDELSSQSDLKSKIKTSGIPIVPVVEPITAGTMTQTTPYGTTVGPVLTTSTPTTDTKADIDLISTPVSKIVEELSKLKTLNEKLDWLKNNNLLSSININGKEYNTIDYSDRIMVLMKIGKYNIPFYISTGQAGKKTVKAGNWYAVFGIGVEKGWINKGNEKQINNNYGFPVFEKLSKILNEGIGVIQSREDNGNGKLKEGIGFLSDSKQDLEAFNNNMNLPTKPAGKNTDTKDFYDHVNSTLSLLNNELKKLSAVSTSTKPSISVSADTIADIETKIQNLFSYTQRGQISLAGEEYDLINAVRKNPTNENVKKFLELYKNEIGKYEQSIVDEVNTELAALETGSGVEENVDEAKINIEREEKRNKKIKTINKEIKEIEKEINELEELQNEPPIEKPIQEPVVEPVIEPVVEEQSASDKKLDEVIEETITKKDIQEISKEEGIKEEEVTAKVKDAVKKSIDDISYLDKLGTSLRKVVDKILKLFLVTGLLISINATTALRSYAPNVSQSEIVMVSNKTSALKVNNKIKVDKSYDKLTQTGKIAYLSEIKNKKAFMIVDKPTATAYVYNEKGVLIKDFVVLLGKNIGDAINKAVPESHIAVGAYTTPGRYILSTNIAASDEVTYRGKMLAMEDSDTPDLNLSLNLALHIVYPGELVKRTKAINSPTIKDNRQSWGCVNISEENYDKYITPNVGKGSVLIVTEEDNLSTVDLKLVSDLEKANTAPTASNTGDTTGATEANLGLLGLALLLRKKKNNNENIDNELKDNLKLLYQRLDDLKQQIITINTEYNKEIASSKSVVAIPEFMTPKEFYAIKTFADVQKWQDKFNDLLNNPVTAKKYNLTSQYVDNKINEFKLLIAERVVFEDLTEGVVILDMNNEQKIVTKKNDNQVIITNLDESGAPVLETSTPITKAEIKQKIKYIYRQGMEDIDLSIKLTEEQTVISNENLQNIMNNITEEETITIFEKSKILTKEEIIEKFKKGLGC